MSMLYVIDNGSSIGISGGNILVKYPDNHEEKIPKETVDAISIYGRSQISTQTVQYCLLNGIRIGYFSQNGNFYGYLQPAEKENIARERKQFAISESEAQCVVFSKQVIFAKINNQITVLRRFFVPKNRDVETSIAEMARYKNKIENCKEISQIMGYEGLASRLYFSCFAKVYGDAWDFKGRGTRPALDPINSMLNFGYSILHKEIVGELVQHGLNPYAGFIHRDKTGHASLASDLIEEWRPVIVDSVVVVLLKDGAVTGADFSFEEGECKMNNNAIRLLLFKMEQKMQSRVSYLTDIKKELTFRETIGHQCERLAKCIDEENFELYSTVKIR